MFNKCLLPFLRFGFLFIYQKAHPSKKMMIIRGFNVSLGSCGFSYVFSCLRLLSDVGIKKIHIGNRYVRKAWNLAFSIG